MRSVGEVDMRNSFFQNLKFGLEKNKKQKLRKQIILMVAYSESKSEEKNISLGWSSGLIL